MMRAPEWIGAVIVGGGVLLGLVLGYVAGRAHERNIEAKRSREHVAFMKSRRF